MVVGWTDRRGLLQTDEGICRAALEDGFNDIVPYVITETGYGCWAMMRKGRLEGEVHTVRMG